MNPGGIPRLADAQLLERTLRVLDTVHSRVVGAPGGEPCRGRFGLGCPAANR